MYKVKFVGYCGMSHPEASHETEKEARADVAYRLKYARKGFEVVTLESGKSWEILEPTECTMVPDDSGVLYLKHITYACRECGSACETQEDAALCCAPDEWFDDDIRDTGYDFVD